MEFSRIIEIKFNWWTNDKKEVSFDVQEQLEGEAENMIFKMRVKGYTSGEFHSEIDGINYQGWFEINYV